MTNQHRDSVLLEFMKSLKKMGRIISKLMPQIAYIARLVTLKIQRKTSLGRRQKEAEVQITSACSYLHWFAVMTTVLNISSTLHPLERSFTGFAIPCRIGPIALAPENRWTSL